MKAELLADCWFIKADLDTFLVEQSLNQQAGKSASLKKLHASNMKLLNKDELQTAEAALLKHLPKSFKVDGCEPF